jgi:hypothetical protein
MQRDKAKAEKGEKAAPKAAKKAEEKRAVTRAMRRGRRRPRNRISRPIQIGGDKARFTTSLARHAITSALRIAIPSGSRKHRGDIQRLPVCRVLFADGIPSVIELWSNRRSS